MKRLVRDNRGLSLVELIVVIAIMAVMLVAGGFTIAMLTGAEAKQAANKLSAQLNDAKTGAMSRAAEELELKFIGSSDLSSYDGLHKTGFYAIKTVKTISKSSTEEQYTVTVTKDGTSGGEADTESDRIASGKVKITLTLDGTAKVLTGAGGTGDVSGVIISYDRGTGKLNKVKDSAGNPLGELEKITFECGSKKIDMEFQSDSGMHTIN